MEPCLWFRKGHANGASKKYNVYRGFLAEPAVRVAGGRTLYTESVFGMEVSLWRKLLFLSPGKQSEKVTMMNIKATLTSNTMSRCEKHIP